MKAQNQENNLETARDKSNTTFKWVKIKLAFDSTENNNNNK